jgi:hypothetical protein
VAVHSVTISTLYPAGTSTLYPAETADPRPLNDGLENLPHLRHRVGDQKQPAREAGGFDPPVLKVSRIPLFSQTLFQKDGVVVADGESDAMPHPEQHEVPADALPDAKHDENREYAERDRVVGGAGPEFANQRLGKGREHQISDPRGQGDMPTVPEFLNIAREKRVVEVLPDRDAEERRDADSHVAKPGEVEIQKQGEGKHRDNEVDTRVWMAVQQQPAVGELIHNICEDQIFRRTHQNAEQGVARVGARAGSRLKRWNICDHG